MSKRDYLKYLGFASLPAIATKIQPMTLPQETIDKIKANAAKATNKRDEKSREGSKDYGRRISFLDGFEEGHNAGATEWAGKAQGLADALKLIEQMSDPGSYEKAVYEMKSIASDALAKYKEVSNG